MEDKEYIRKLYASTPRPSEKRTKVKIFNGYCYYKSSTLNHDKIVYYLCKDRSTEGIKCPGNGYLYKDCFYEEQKHNHPINNDDNLKRLFKDEIFEVSIMFPHRSAQILYNEVLEEYTDEAQEFIRKNLQFENIRRSIVNWRLTYRKIEKKNEPRKRQKPRTYSKLI